MPGRSIYVIGALLVAGLSIFLSRSPTAPDSAQPKTFPGRNNTVLFLSDTHAGLANVHVATSHAILVEYPDLELHYASFPKLEKTISETSAFAAQQNTATKAIQFHPLVGRSYAQSLDDVGFYIANAIQPSGLEGIASLCNNMQDFLMPWTATDYLAIYKDVLRLLDEIDPIIVVVDPIFGPALDAIRTQGRNHAILSPNNLKDNFVSMQPWASMFWKYPAISSGYPYPVPWRLIPANFYLTIRFIYSVLHTPRLAEKKAFLKANGIAKPLDVFTIYQKDYLWLSQGLPEAEFPMVTLPSNLVTCGPIFRSTAPAEQQDPELAAWLSRAPTVLINLGSKVDYDENGAGELVKVIKTLLANSTVQVLWKFNKRGPFSQDVFSEVSDEIKEGRLRLEKWLNIDPAAMLETGHIAVSVHHGGANCFFEAVGVGIPQIVLPLWVDLYDYATRVEYLGIGVLGSPVSAPNWTSSELTTAFTRVLDGGQEALRIKETARRLGEVARKAGGRFRAAEEISKLARMGSG
ncbi:glycosyltransferase family 1 protein [Mollisia scopiformis]|uniref:Glycosyltransferase family 1 protein n=1 Tax=Mollisia scopiformis TaxID=149040 RepID=A0A132BB58_MOLSC|nr:glycosyltransferase family 1 protein [Mollisia scopiformis]KUJ09626.1 glycosyltransferase family 1 protein [Mollisia scopiformis]